MNGITSASCSMAPDSRRSDITGRLFGRCSSERFSCDSAITGAFQFLSEPFSEREISRSRSPGSRLAAAGHQLQVVDDDQAELAALAVQAAGTGAQVDRVQGRRLVDVDRLLVDLAERAYEGATTRRRSACPVRALFWSMTAHRGEIRMIQLGPPFQAEHATGKPLLDATFRRCSGQTPSCPIDGRPATMIRSPGWKPGKSSGRDR